MELSRNRSAPRSRRQEGLRPRRGRRLPDRGRTALETAQNQATAMEARARAAVAELQEVASAAPCPSHDAGPARRRRRPPTPDACRVRRPTRPRRSAARCCSPSAPPTRPSPRRRPRPTRITREATTEAEATLDSTARCRPSCSRRPAPRPAGPPRPSGSRAEGEVQALWPAASSSSATSTTSSSTSIDQRERLRGAARQHRRPRATACPAGSGRDPPPAAVGVRRRTRRRHRRDVGRPTPTADRHRRRAAADVDPSKPSSMPTTIGDADGGRATPTAIAPPTAGPWRHAGAAVSPSNAASD